MTDSGDARGRDAAAGGGKVVALAPFREARRARVLLRGVVSLGADARAIAGAGRSLDGALCRLTEFLTLDDAERVAARHGIDETRRVTAAIESGDLEAMLALRDALQARRVGTT